MNRAPAREPSIAVIIPNRNDARYLPRCLRSVLGQQVPPDELIVIDDQSTDDSVSVIRSLIDGHAMARLIENPNNLGVYGAVDRGLEQSGSDYALFLSANDFLLPGLIARAKSCLARAPGAGLWSAMAWLVDQDDRLLRMQSTAVPALEDAFFTPEDCRRLAWRFGNWFTGTSLVYHRKTLDAAGRFDPAYKGLADLITALTVASRRGAAYSPEPLAVIRAHAGILSATLRDPAELEAMLERLAVRGPALSPELFTREFLARTGQRFRFAAIRAAAGGRVLRLPRVALAFLALRPYDVIPAIWNRMLGSLWIRLRSRWRAPA
jgi:glycosyltransferase involved in cell wall biosynthesis